MIQVAFLDATTKWAALAFLLGRYSFQVHPNSDVLIAERGLGALTRRGFAFDQFGHAEYERLWPYVVDGPDPMRFRRYDILFPLLDRDRQPIPLENLAEALLGLAERFGWVAFSGHADTFWPPRLDRECDEFATVTAIAPDTESLQRAVREFRPRLNFLLRRERIGMMATLVELF